MCSMRSLQYIGGSSYTDQQNSAKYNSSAVLNKYGWYPQVGCMQLTPVTRMLLMTYVGDPDATVGRVKNHDNPGGSVSSACRGLQ